MIQPSDMKDLTVARATSHIVFLPARSGHLQDAHTVETEHRVRLADGRTLACLALGAPAGPPVLYFHGYPGSRIEGRLAAAAAGRLGLRVLAIDRPGFGDSTFQPGRNLGTWATDVAALADQLALERFSIVGVSGGGSYALACAAAIPDRLNRVALVCPLGPLDSAKATAGMLLHNRLMLALAASVPPLGRATVRAVVQWIRRDPERHLGYMMRGVPSADREVLADPGYRTVLIESLAQALRQGGRGVAWELTVLSRPWDFRLQDVRMPVSIWQGLADNIVPAAMARRLAAGLPRCEPHYIRNEGHLSLIVRHLGAVLADLHS